MLIRILLLISAATLFWGCGESSDHCDDTGCNTGEYCVADGSCEATCTKDTECDAGYFCGEPTQAQTPTCLPRSSFEKYGDRWTSGAHMILISDATSSGQACLAESEGADIVYVRLENGGGVELGYGNIVTRFPTDGAPVGNFTGQNLNGTAPTFEGECPDISDPEHSMSLGCGGAIAMEFLDAEGTPIELVAGMEIIVFEHGRQCTSGGLDDLYQVSTCSDAYALADGDVNSCRGGILTEPPVSGETTTRLGRI